jgi:hypothetical protein
VSGKTAALRCRKLIGVSSVRETFSWSEVATVILVSWTSCAIKGDLLVDFMAAIHSEVAPV